VEDFPSRCERKLGGGCERGAPIRGGGYLLFCRDEKNGKHGRYFSHLSHFSHLFSWPA
jgi:hypothetical protein